MAYSYFETTVSALESAKRTVSGVDYYDLSYTNLDYTPLFSTTQVDADKYVSDVGDTLQVTLGENTLDRSSNTDLWIVNPSSNRVEINTSDSAWTSLNPQNSDIVRLSRISKKDAPYVDYANAAVLTEQDLDAQAKQSLHIVQESIDIANDGLTLSTDGKWDGASGGSNRNIKNVATPSSSDPSHYVATKGYVDGSSSSQTVASISDEINTVAGISSKVETVAGAIKETIAYTVDVANNVFRIQGGEFSSATEKPTLNLQRGSTYTFNYTHSSISSGSHVLGFSSTDSNTAFSGATAYTTGVTNDTVNKIITLVVDASAPNTLYYYCTNSSHNAMGNTMNIAEDSIEIVADNIANVNKVGAIDGNVTKVANIDSDVTKVVALGTDGAHVTTVATLGTNGADVTTVAGKATEINTLVNGTDGTSGTGGTNTNITQVDTVADAIANVNSVATNISQVTTFSDTYHTAGTTEPSGSNVTEGDLWFDNNTGVKALKVYDGSSWGLATSSISSVASTSEFTASNGQGTGNKYFAVNHDVGLELVFLNGVRLKRGSDYYCTNSNTSTTPISSGNGATFVRLETVPGSSDILSVMAFGQIANNLAVNTAGGTFTGGVTFEAGTTHNLTSNNTSFTLPTTRGTDNYVLTRDDTIGTGGTTWKETIIPPTITSITYPTESGVVPTALQASGGSDNNVKTLTITNGGTGYSGSGTLSATGGGGNGFAGTYTVSGGVIDSVTITDAGQEYTSAPTIVVSGSTSGTSAVITASILETLLINGENLGSASNPPTVQIQVSGSYVAFAGTVSCNASGTVVTCANVTKQASADNYNLRVSHGTNGQTVSTTVNFSADPSFSTASGSLGTVYTGSAMSTKTITAGSSVSWYEGTPAMPTWMTHFADGASGTSQNLTGTPDNGSNTSEVQNFNIIIRDSENQSHNRDFSLTVIDLPASSSATIIEPGSYTGGGYRSHTWTSTGTFTSAFSLYTTTIVDILIVAGGGAGSRGTNGGGGGGAGGMRVLTSQSLNAGDYTIVVGAGGGAPGGANSYGASGNPSSITQTSGTGSFSSSATGGGRAGVWNSLTQSDRDGADGGSGGGAGETYHATSSSLDESANSGGTGDGALPSVGGNGANGNTTGYYGGDGGDALGGTNVSRFSGAGGGGAGGDGANGGFSGSQYTGALGGIGLENSFRTGSAVKYAGGGAGNGDASGYQSGGGVSFGGGTSPGGANAGGNGGANTGGGGGGGASGAGAGGSGIVVIRYAV